MLEYNDEVVHYPVMRTELVSALSIVPNGTYIDCTGGAGGHSGLILENLHQDGKLIIFDQDTYAIEYLKKKFQQYSNVTIIHSNFANIKEHTERLNLGRIDGVCADLGVSSFQFGYDWRGFSFNKEGKLDMRMNTSEGRSAYDVVNDAPQHELINIIRHYGEEKFAVRIADFIVKRRKEKPIELTTDLANIIYEAVPKKFHKKGFHPATRTFQALRIFVNDELGSIERLIESVLSLLSTDGRFGVISFHSLEDRIVKQSFAKACKGCVCPPNFPICVCGKKPIAEPVTRKAIVPTDEEIATNPPSRSAKLRAIRKL